jgi:hypothetical protein
MGTTRHSQASSRGVLVDICMSHADDVVVVDVPHMQQHSQMSSTASQLGKKKASHLAANRNTMHVLPTLRRLISDRICRARALWPICEADQPWSTRIYSIACPALAVTDFLRNFELLREKHRSQIMLRIVYKIYKKSFLHVPSKNNSLIQLTGALLVSWDPFF